MDAVSVITNTPISNVIAGLATSGRINNASSGGLASGRAEPSVRVQFSAFVTNLLAQQANDPSQSIDVALARSLAGVTLDAVTGGPLYTASGLLQQFATAQLLAQRDGTGQVSTQSLTGISDAAQELALANSLSLLDQTAQLTPSVQQLTNSLANTPIRLVTESTPPLPVATPEAVTELLPTNAIASPPVATTTSTVADANVVVDPAIPFPNPDEPLLFDNVDPYRQAALISGLSSFGKEQSDFIQATSEAVTAAAVGAVTAVRANRALMNEAEEAAANVLS